MIAIATESSNIRGMGHLFRTLLYVDYLKRINYPFCILINKNIVAEDILKKKNIGYILVDYSDVESNWEEDLIKRFNIQLWLNDKFETSRQMGQHIHDAGISFFVIDDIGTGEKYANISFCGMLYPTKTSYLCEKVYKGTEYVILNPEILQYRRIRNVLHKMIVTLGGSDTYGATLEVVKILKKFEVDADILVGPDFQFFGDLEKISEGKYKILRNLPSLIKIFSDYDLAITGGGITCCEAMASGLPCLVIANEEHEVNTANFFSQKGACIYLGMHGGWNYEVIGSISKLNLNEMSRKGMDLFSFDAVDRIFEIIFSA